MIHSKVSLMGTLRSGLQSTETSGRKIRGTTVRCSPQGPVSKTDNVSGIPTYDTQSLVSSKSTSKTALRGHLCRLGVSSTPRKRVVCTASASHVSGAPASAEDKVSQSHSGADWLTKVPWSKSILGIAWRLFTEVATQFILPLASVYCAWFGYVCFASQRAVTWPEMVAFAYAIAEVGFVLVHALQKRKLEAMPNPTHSIPDEKNLPDRMRSLRIALLNLQQSLAPLQPSSRKSLSQKPEREQRAAEICGWFVKGPLGHSAVHPSWQEVGHEKLMSWLAWAFWNSHLDDAAPRDEVEVMVTEVEAWVAFGYADDYTDTAHAYDFGDQLVPGEWRHHPTGHPDVEPLRLTLDPITSKHRPLAAYVVTDLLMRLLLPTVLLTARGFRKHYCESTSLAYWVRVEKPQDGQEGCDQDAMPIVFVHGLGVGVLPYIAMLDTLLEGVDASRSVVLMELPFISLSLAPSPYVPSPKETVNSLMKVLKEKVGSTGGVHLVGHSFGSVVMAWMVKRAPAQYVRACTFIDPVCFLLYKYNVAFNFMYKPPVTPLDCAIKYFVGLELHTANLLHRHFFWNHNVLCPTLLESVPTLVVLSEDDIIVPSAAVARHMLQFPSPTTEVMVLEGHAHAQFIAMPDTCLRILERFRHVETQVVACQTVRATST